MSEIDEYCKKCVYEKYDKHRKICRFCCSAWEESRREVTKSIRKQLYALVDIVNEVEHE